MIRKQCGNCYFQVDSENAVGGVRILCSYDKQWHANSDTCLEWLQYSYKTTDQEREQAAQDLRNNKAQERRHQQNLKMAKWGIIVSSAALLIYIIKLIIPALSASG